jgi:superoxide dismutase, Cu-Zn family
MAKLRRAVLAGALAAVTIGVAALVMSAPAGASRPLARAVLLDEHGTRVGEVVFKCYGAHADRATITVDAPAAPGLGDFHGLHVHTTGSCVAPAFTSAGGHWNPTGAAHGQHVGDLPSVLVSATGRAYLDVETPRFAVADLFDADGSAVVLHVGRDNFANIPVDPYGGAVGGTLNTGDAGGRYACGVVTR